MSDLPSANDEHDAWTAYFRRYDRITLVANSEDVSREALEAQPDGTLFVFFNRVFKVLDRPFERSSLLVARCSNIGTNLVYRGEQNKVLPLVSTGHFDGVVMLRAASHERPDSGGAFAPHAVSALDLTSWFDGIYPLGNVPTSGFSLAAWLTAEVPNLPVQLAGFSSKRSDKWKLFDVHDWTYEQIALAALIRAGRLSRLDVERPEWPLHDLLARYPDVDHPDSTAIAEVLAARLRGTNLLVDRIWSQLKPIRAVDNWLRSLKPKKRRDKIAEAQARKERKGE